MKSKSFNREKILQSVSAILFKRKEIDDNAETCEEISKKNVGNSVWQVRRELKKQLAAGRVEMVWKQVGRQLVPAYRMKRIK